MLILGIDLAAQSRRTAACMLQCSDGVITADTPRAGLYDDGLLALREQASWIGVDAPIGFPAAFTEVAGWAAGGSWPRRASPRSSVTG